MNNLEEKKDKIKTWLKNPYNLALILILILAFIIRIYYFSLASQQPLWWDEADYMAYAKNLAGINNGWSVTPQHNSIFPYIASVFFMLNLSEPIIRFVLEVLPSVILVFLSYIVGKEMYNKKTGLVVSFLIAVNWVLLFNTNRFHLGIPGNLFALLSMYVFWKGYVKKQKFFKKINSKWALPFVAIFVALAFMIRRGYFILGFFYLFFVIFSTPLKKYKSFIINKYNWLALILIAGLVFIAEKIIFTVPVVGKKVAGAYFHPDRPINLDFLNTSMQIFKSAFGFNVLFYLFWIGFVILAVKTIFYFNVIRKIEKTHPLKSNLFILLSILLNWSLYLLYFRTPGEPRQFMLIFFALSVCTAKGMLFFSTNLKKYLGKNRKLIATLFVLSLLLYAGYHQITYSDLLIKNKINSFSGIKKASLYIKEISEPTDIILTISQPQAAYYAERQTVIPVNWLNWSENNVPFEPVLEKIKQTPNVKYIVITFSEPNHPEWMKKIQYAEMQGQTVMAKWEIPFMDTYVDFINQQQKIEKQKTYDNIIFEFDKVFDDAFVYKIKRI